MNDDELEQAIADIASDETLYVSTWGCKLSINGTLTHQEIVAIAELLKKEGRA